MRPSVREQTLRLIALAITLLVTCVLTAAALFGDPRHPMQVWAAVVASAAVAVFSARRLRARLPAARLEVAIDANGQPWLRATDPVADGSDGGGAPLAQCRFAAPWLITLQCGALRAPVWPDSLPAEAFRRLHACVRWARPAHDAAPVSTPSSTVQSS